MINEGGMSDFELSEEEIKEIRRIIENDKRARWLWASMRNIAVWIVAVIGGVSIAYESLGNAIKHLAGK